MRYAIGEESGVVHVPSLLGLAVNNSKNGGSASMVRAGPACHRRFLAFSFLACYLLCFAAHIFTYFHNRGLLAIQQHVRRDVPRTYVYKFAGRGRARRPRRHPSKVAGAPGKEKARRQRATYSYVARSTCMRGMRDNHHRQLHA